MDHVDMQYCGVLSMRLEGFVVKSNAPYRANCRCPLCGDSAQSKSKKRGWLLEESGAVIYYCHNCFASHRLITFLKIYDVSLYNQYIVDRAIDNKPAKKTTQPIKQKKEPPKFRRVDGAKPLTLMDSKHPCIKYVCERKIPKEFFKYIYYTPKFKKFVNNYIPDKMVETRDEPRLVFPFFDADKNFFGFSGRSFDPNSKAKYLTIMLDETKRKIYGEDRIDYNKQYLVVEGQIDSLFLKNCLAMVGADGKISALPNHKNAVGIFDNEPRNKQIVKRMSDTLKEGCSIVIWPEDLSYNDINDMVLAGVDPQKIIDENIYSGLSGELKLAEWKKI